MRANRLSGPVRVAMYAVLMMLAMTPVKAVEAQVKPLISKAVDESQQVRLKGSVPAQVRAAKDLGEVDRSQPAGRLLLVLKRSDEQETALQSFLLQAHQQTSAGYHKWLAPGEFGTRFGAADSDIEQLKGWLQAHGLTVAKVLRGKDAIEFSGTIGQVSDAFHTSIHQYSLKNEATGKVETHYANASDPSVPAAFGSVVAGVSQLNDFRPQPMMKTLGRAKYNVKTHGVTPQWTYGEGAGYAPFYILAPEDFSTQYDVKPVYTAGVTGAGQTIGIINDSNIDIGLVNAYRKLFGLSVNPPQVVIDGNDPGITGDAREAYLDVENAGSIAPDATVTLYIAGYVGLLGEGGLEFSLARAVDDDAAPVLSLSFGYCEAGLRTAGNAYQNSLWEQAAAQGQTVMVASGDSGSIGFGCEFGLGVNGLGSTPWNVAVGGTDAYFSDYATGGASISSFWGSSNDASLGSLQKKFAEQPWDGTQFGLNSTLYDPVDDQPFDTGAGGGGPSTCAVGGDTFDQNTGLPICVSGYAKPAWQVGSGVPNDLVRDVPDVSLFASNGYNGIFWPVCAEEGDCTEIDPAVGETFITGVGGTSASAPAMAGIMALVNQKYGPQGQADFTLYPLAVQFPAAFNDVKVGSNNEPCSDYDVGYEFGCALDANGDGYYSYGGYSAGAGYDLASGLGTIDVNQLITNWGSITFKSTTTTLTLTPTTLTHGQSVTGNVAVTGSGTPTGAVALVDSATLANNAGLGTVELSAGAGTYDFTTLPGGTYTVTAEYGGDGVNAASKSSPVTVTVSPEASSLLFRPVYLSGDTFSSAPITTGSNVPYGDAVLLDVTVDDAAGQEDGYATGTVTFTDGLVTIGTANVSAAGIAEFNGSLLAVGSHTIGASYSGDASYKASTSSTVTFTISKATTLVEIAPDFSAIYNDDGSIGFYAGQSPNIAALVGAELIPDGLFPTGTVMFQLGSGTPVSVPLVPGETFETGYGSLLASVASEVLKNLALGTQTLTVTYSGDANYAGTSATQVIEVVAPAGLLPSTTTFAITSPASLANITPSTVITATVTVTGSGGVAPTGAVTPTLGNLDEFYPITLTPGAGTVSTATFQVRAADFLSGANTLSMNYSGDNVYEASSSGTVVVVDDSTDFTIQAQTPNLSMASGASTTATISLASINGYNGAVNLACATVSPLTCTVAAASVDLNGNTTTTVTINSGATASVHGDEQSGRFGLGFAGSAGGTVLACLMCLMLPRRRRVGRMLCGVLGMAMLAAGISGCGGSSAGATKTPPTETAKTYSVVVTGTGTNGLVHNTLIAVEVQ
jgi:hypothetical protein